MKKKNNKNLEIALIISGILLFAGFLVVMAIISGA